MRAILLSILIWCLLGGSYVRLEAQGLDDYTKVANRLMELMNGMDYPAIENLFNKEMATALPLDKTTEIFKNLNSNLGKLEKLDPPRTPPPAVIFTAHFERGMLDLQLSLDEQEQIGGIYFKPHT